MKRLIALVLALIICLSMAACSNMGMATELVGKDDSGNPCINYSQFKTIIEKVDLTAENWKEYLAVYSYEEPASDEGEEPTVHYYIGTEATKYHAFMTNSILKLKDKETGHVAEYNLGLSGATVSSVFSLDDYEFVEIDATLYYLDIPEEVILKDEDGDAYFVVYHYFPVSKESTSEKILLNEQLKVFRKVDYINAVYNTPG